MEELRTTIRSAAPDVTEAISYNMPAFRLNGRFLVSYEAFKHHYSLFPWSDSMVAGLGGHDAALRRREGNDPLPGR